MEFVRGELVLTLADTCRGAFDPYRSTDLDNLLWPFVGELGVTLAKELM